MFYDGFWKDYMVIQSHVNVAIIVLYYAVFFFHSTNEGNVKKCEFCGEESDKCKEFFYKDYATGKTRTAVVCKGCRRSTVIAEMILKARKEI